MSKWNVENDNKFKSLESLLNEHHKGDKVLVFSQFSDTVDYLYKNLNLNGTERLDIATGKSVNPTNSAQRFSPKAMKS